MHFLKALTPLTLICTLLFSTHLNAQRYKNLVLEGGGIRGIAYAGAIEVLESHHITDSLQNIAGTSVGAITAAALATGYASQELTSLLYTLKIQSFNDGQYIFLGGFSRMSRQYGWYKGNALERWIGHLIEAKTGSAHTTFLQLHNLALTNNSFKDLYITGTNLSLQRPEVFSYLTHPYMEIKTAVRTSMSIPLYFTAVTLDSTGNHPSDRTRCTTCYIYTDGGLIQNYPLTLFDTTGIPNPSTLGLKLERPEQIPYFNTSEGIAPYSITTFRSYVSALYNLTIETLNRKAPISEEAPRTIYISTEGITPRVRRMPRYQKDLLVRSGRSAATAYFTNHPH